MKIAKYALKNRVVTLVLTFVMLGAGLLAYQNLSRLEDPEFTIKEALVFTPYPGASSVEVEEEVTDEIEIAVQRLGQLDEIESRSERGLSTVTVRIKDKYDKNTLPQVWDELRRKVSDMQRALPPGAGPSIVFDDFGDVYGVFFAIHSDEYSYAELKKVVDLLRRELLLVEDVAKVETFGELTEAVYVQLDRDRMSQIGISPEVVAYELGQKNVVADAGAVKVGSEFISIAPTGAITSIEAFESILISGGGDRQILLRDIATVTRGYVDPATEIIRYGGRQAIGLGISTVSGGNVVVMGEGVKKRIEELRKDIPLGIELGTVSFQSDAVTTAINGFVLSLLEAIAIVIVVLLLFMGLRSGLLIGFVLLVTIAGSFIFLGPMGVALERVSLGALIIALGMLVDNAIVVVDGILVRIQKGMDRTQAAIEVVRQSAIPLLGATIIAVLGFAAIGTSQDSTGEFCRSLFQVVMTSLLLSWVTAVTITPLLGVMFLKAPSGGSDNPYGGKFYSGYRGFLQGCLKRRWLTMLAVIGLFFVSMFGFGFVDQSFFPESTRPQFKIDFWLPQGTHIEETTENAKSVEAYLAGLDGVTNVSTVIGQGALRFTLTYQPQRTNSSYAQFLVDVDDYTIMDEHIRTAEKYLSENYPEAQVYGSKFPLGPGSTGKIQARFIGEDANVLRELASRTMDLYQAHPNTKGIRTDWRQRVKVLRPIVQEETANLNGIQRSAIAATIREGFQGQTVGVYREGDILLPIIMRAELAQRSDVSSIQNLQIWSPAAREVIPLRQVVSGFETDFEDEIIIRKNRKRTITVYCDPIEGNASALFAQLRPEIEQLPLPEGYTREWGGEYEDSTEAQGQLAAGLPLFVLLMVLMTIALFNSLKKPFVIWACVPLALIGVTVGLLGTGNPFGFMALLGFLSLMGMLIKNAIVLIDEITLQQEQGSSIIQALLDSGVSRLRPVAMAALTTALGMIPLLFDPFFASMAVTIIGGLIFATLLTMVVVPVIYAMVFRAKA